MSNRRKALIIAAGALSIVVLWSAWCLWHAGSAGSRVRSALVAAETSLEAHDVPATRKHLADASAALDEIDDNLTRLGPIRNVGHIVPIVRVQLRGVEAFADAGHEITDSAARLTDAIDELLHPKDPNASLETTLEPMRNLDARLRDGLTSLQNAARKMNTLKGDRLLGPLNGARQELDRRLTEGLDKATDAQQGVTALLDFVGGSGPRRYLVLAQNPDEVRPTGGFVGSYGVLEADGAKVHLDYFQGITTFTANHPGVVVPDAEAATPFHYSPLGLKQGMGNINASVDWPNEGPVAQRLWNQAGEPPVDGVVLITPDMLVRMLKVLGPVTIPEYGESVTAQNFLERLEFHTHVNPEETEQHGGKKEFLGAAADPIVRAIIHAPTDKWIDIAEQLGASGDAREWMGWSAQSTVQDVLAHQQWDGALPETGGDFFYDADFEYAAKNGRGLRRTFDHVVQLHPDGSATVETTMTIANTEPPDTPGYPNIQASLYVAVYGPTGGSLAPGSTDPDVTTEFAVAGHPAVGYALLADPLDSDTVKVVWDVPQLLTRNADGSWTYDLLWRHVTTNSGDQLHLRVETPPGWKWANAAPPTDVRLDKDFRGSWRLEPDH